MTLRRVIEALDLERYILIGHSMGGKVSQLIASRHPRGLAGLALIAPSPPSPLNLPLEVRQGMVRAYDTRASIIATVEQVLAPNGLNPEDLETVIADSLAGAPAAKKAWPLFASQEDIAAAVVGIESRPLSFQAKAIGSIRRTFFGANCFRAFRKRSFMCCRESAISCPTRRLTTSPLSSEPLPSRP